MGLMFYIRFSEADAAVGVNADAVDICVGFSCLQVQLNTRIITEALQPLGLREDLCHRALLVLHAGHRAQIRPGRGSAFLFSV